MPNTTAELTMTDAEIVDNYGFTDMNNIRLLYHVRDALPIMAELVNLGIESVEATAEGRPLRQEVRELLTGEGGNALFQFLEGFRNAHIGPEEYQHPLGDGEPEIGGLLTRDEHKHIATFRRLPKWKQILIILAIRAPRPIGRVIVRGLLMVTPKPN
jgi:hypothetical protein